MPLKLKRWVYAAPSLDVDTTTRFDAVGNESRRKCIVFGSNATVVARSADPAWRIVRWRRLSKTSTLLELPPLASAFKYGSTFVAGLVRSSIWTSRSRRSSGVFE